LPNFFLPKHPAILGISNRKVNLLIQFLAMELNLLREDAGSRESFNLPLQSVEEVKQLDLAISDDSQRRRLVSYSYFLFLLIVKY